MGDMSDLQMAIFIGLFLAVTGALWQLPTLAGDVREGKGGTVVFLVVGSAIAFAVALFVLDLAFDLVLN